jgi:hypothetical protein
MTVRIDASGGEVLRIDKRGVVIALKEMYPGISGMLTLVSAKEDTGENCVLGSASLDVGPHGGFRLTRPPGVGL